MTPHLPMRTFSLRLPRVGVAQQPGVLRGYVRPVAGGTIMMHVAAPPRTSLNRLRTYANGHLVAHSIKHGLAVFALPTDPDGPANWAVTGSASHRSARHRRTSRRPRARHRASGFTG